MSNLSEPARKSAIKVSIMEASNALLQAESHKDHAKSVVEHICSEYEMDKALVNALVRMYHKQNSEEIRAKSESIIDEYENIFG